MTTSSAGAVLLVLILPVRSFLGVHAFIRLLDEDLNGSIRILGGAVQGGAAMSRSVGECAASSTRRFISSSAWESDVSGRTSMNSSPPMRQARSELRRLASIAAATRRMNPSPAAVEQPGEVVHCRLGLPESRLSAERAPMVLVPSHMGAITRSPSPTTSCRSLKVGCSLRSRYCTRRSKKLSS